MNKIYYNHIDLVKDVKEAKSDTIFNCDFDIYFLWEYFHIQDREFNWYKEKLRYVIYQENNIKIVTGNLSSVHDVLLTSFGFIPKLVETSRGGVYYCFNITMLINILLDFQKQEINEQIQRINFKYSKQFKEIIDEYEKRKATERNL